MSGSTASLTTANHHHHVTTTSSRRRPPVVVVADVVTDAAEISISGGSHAHAHDSVQLDRSRDDHHPHHLPVKKKPSPVSPRLPRKVPPTPKKPRWVTVASVLGKNMLLLIVLLGFLQMLRNHLLPTTNTNTNTNTSTNQRSSHDDVVIARRISETQSLLQTTTKMMQAQVEVVDRKLEDHIVALRNELSLKIQDNALLNQHELAKIQDRTHSLENSLAEFKHMNFVSRQDFDKFYHELNQNNKDDDDNAVTLDEIRASLKDMIEKEFEKHSADGLGRVDYALASGGAMVIKHSDPYIVAKGSSWFPSRNGLVSSHAHKLLSPSFGEPGQCFPLKGSAGFVQIMLRTPIIPQAFTLEHVSKSVAYDRSSAPKDCRVSGWLQDHNKDAAVEVEMFRLAEFAYDLEKSNNAQTFNVLDTATSGVVNIIRLDFTSNHGSPSHTCIYRFRVHGHEPSSVSMLPMQS